jgi:hypothetical protein
MCPFPDCKEQDVFVQDLIYNHALSKAADWYRRQQIAKAEIVEVEIENTKHDKDISTVAKQMIEQAKAEARNRAKDGSSDVPIINQNGLQKVSLLQAS